MSRAAAEGTSTKKKPATDPAAGDPATTETAAEGAVQPSAGPKPTRGRMIDFTIDEQGDEPETITAVVTKVDGNAMNLTGFHPVLGPSNYYVQDIDATQRATPGERGTWNWPVRS